MQKTHCDICGDIIEPIWPVIRNEDGTIKLRIVGKRIVDGKWKTIDICKNCLKKVEYEEYEKGDGYKYSKLT